MIQLKIEAFSGESLQCSQNAFGSVEQQLRADFDSQFSSDISASLKNLKLKLMGISELELSPKLTVTRHERQVTASSQRRLFIYGRKDVLKRVEFKTKSYFFLFEDFAAFLISSRCKKNFLKFARILEQFSQSFSFCPKKA